MLSDDEKRLKPKEWVEDKRYYGGECVIYDGVIYSSKWYTRGDKPNIKIDDARKSPWMEIGKLDKRIKVPDYKNIDVGRGITWPSKVFAPLIDASSWPPLKFADLADVLMLPFVNLGFIVSENNNSYLPTWGTYYTADEGPLNDQIKKIRKMGGDVTVTFGGVTNVPLQVTAPNEMVLKTQYKDFIKAYGLTRVFFEIDGHWLKQKESIIKNNKAIKLLQDELFEEGYGLDLWFTLPVLPSGLTPLGLFVLKSALNEGVDIGGINIKTMNFGNTIKNPKNKMAEYSIKAAEKVINQLRLLFLDYGFSKTPKELYKMLGVTPMIGMNDVTSEIFDQVDAKELLLYAEKKDIGMLSMWSLNRDKQCEGGKIPYVSISCSSIIQEPYEFTNIFNQYNDIGFLNLKDEIDLEIDIESPSIQAPPSDISYPVWNPEEIYESGDIVTYKGFLYKAKWWNQGEVPDKEVTYPWETPWERIK